MKRLLLSLIITISLQANAQVAIDGYIYGTVIINGREWMSENLKATKYESGTTFQTVTANQFLTAPITNNIQTGPYATPAIIEPAWSSANGNGKLYNFSIVYNQSEIIKTGWHIPSKAEWQQMIDFTNASTSDNMRKVEVGSEQFWVCTGNFVNQYGFSAIGVGRVVVNSDNTSANMDFIGDGAFFWSVTTGEDGQTNVSAVNINCNGIGAGQFFNANYTINRRSALSVRLIKDVPLSTGYFDKSNIQIYPNPTKDIFNVKSENELTELSIFDMTGKCVYSQSTVSETINIESLENGIYLIKVSTAEGIYSQKLLKD